VIAAVAAEPAHDTRQVRVLCERCLKKQWNRKDDRDIDIPEGYDPRLGFYGCRSCHWPYGRYAASQSPRKAERPHPVSQAKRKRRRR